MKNVTLSVDKNVLVIRVDLTQDFGPSSSGKTRIVATTAGNAEVPEHDDIKLGLNVYRRGAPKVHCDALLGSPRA
jgi:hypothetical protein